MWQPEKIKAAAIRTPGGEASPTPTGRQPVGKDSGTGAAGDTACPPETSLQGFGFPFTFGLFNMAPGEDIFIQPDGPTDILSTRSLIRADGPTEI